MNMLGQSTTKARKIMYSSDTRKYRSDSGSHKSLVRVVTRKYAPRQYVSVAGTDSGFYWRISGCKPVKYVELNFEQSWPLNQSWHNLQGG